LNYSELTRQYFETAAGAGVLTGAGVGRGSAGSREQGTWVQFDVRVGPQANPVEQGAEGHIAACVQAARFLAFGCPHTIAVSAWIAEQAIGREPAAALPENVHRLAQRFDVPTPKLGRLLMVEDAWVAAVIAAMQ
jgi:hypothetical protein